MWQTVHVDRDDAHLGLLHLFPLESKSCLNSSICSDLRGCCSSYMLLDHAGDKASILPSCQSELVQNDSADVLCSHYSSQT